MGEAEVCGSERGLLTLARADWAGKLREEEERRTSLASGNLELVMQLGLVVLTVPFPSFLST